ncbi:2,3-bisphosphoglycerate-independent phosphoglycerate mutase, partial [Patescibacteria group bacterium]|nr:2,3-bisphosphoglycerate-independent phosphoglycerate mutase [Patescibacteria group bacterium]
DKTIEKNKAILKAFKNVKKQKSALHLLGMISDQGVHSHQDHLFALMKLAKKNGIKQVYIHAITDGRDVPERSGERFIKKIKSQIKKIGIGEIVTMIGRYYAMDRDKNFDRTQKAFDLYTKGKGVAESDPINALKNQYAKGVASDYYIEPIILNKEGVIKNKDSVIFFNYRSDRAMQITGKFMNKKVKPVFVCFGPYSEKADIAFGAPKIQINLGKFISKKKMPQLRIAETEKYAHVTFFFNSQDKQAYEGENRILIPSPKVASYAQKPEMSAKKITSALKKELEQKDYKLVVLNFANCDLVGHSGDYDATLKAVETVDEQLSKIVPFALKKDYDIIITADHGNAEYMIYKGSNAKCPSHSLNPVICIVISEKYKKIKTKRKGGLRDIAPTILDLMNYEKPKQMKGSSLIIKKK